MMLWASLKDPRGKKDCVDNKFQIMAHFTHEYTLSWSEIYIKITLLQKNSNEAIRKKFILGRLQWQQQQFKIHEKYKTKCA